MSNDISVSQISGGGLTTIGPRDVKLDAGLYLDENCKWRMRVQKASQTIHWGIRTSGYTMPVLPPDPGANINCGNAMDAVNDMAAYSVRQGAGAWHSPAASTTHEMHHVEWFRNLAVTTWPAYEAEIELKELGSSPAMTESQAGAEMTAYIEQKRLDWYDAKALAPEPPAYAEGQVVLDSIIAQIMAWQATGCP